MSGENRRLGCFHLLDEVGRGSQGVVYKAICESDGFKGVSVGTVVAIRALSVDPGDKDYEVRLGKRITELKALSHPAVARSLGSFCEKGTFGDMRVLVQEWFEGESLGAWLRRNPNGLDADMALRIGGQLLDALAYISSKGVVLGSVQPNHVVLCKDGSVKLAAFEYPVQQKPCMPTVCPPLNYTAPEFLNAEFRGDERSDIFSFGVCFHEMLTGRLPYAAQSHTPTIAEFFERWHGGDNAPIMIHPSVKRIMIGASETLEKALRGKREERYATFADFAAAFKGIRCRELTHGDNTWRLLQYVGRGSFGEVFKARDVKTGQVVAIKRLMKSQYADRFKREARALSQLNDSSIVRFISFFEKEMGGCKHAFLVMECLDGMPGQSLRDELRRASGKSIRRDLVIRAFVNYAHGLSVMHAKGFVHRDIKPGKLYFPTDAIDRALIMSSTIVRDMSGTITTGAVPGTLDYMPPEVAVTEDRGSPAMDVFALGLSLYEALSGKMAYSRLPTGTAGLLAFVKRAKEKTRPDLDESSYADLPDLVRLVREMTEPDVTKRLKDAAEVERRLRALLVEEDDDNTARWDDSEPQTLYAAPSFDELEIVDAPSCLPDFDEIRRANESAFRRVRWSSWMKKYLVGVPLLIFASLGVVGCVVGAFWLGEFFVRGAVQELGDSLAVRATLLFPWLIGIVVAEARLGRMPDVLTGGCLLTGIGISIFADGVSLISSIGAVAAGAAVLFPFFLKKAIGSGAVMLFAGTLSFWGIRWFPFALVSFLFMFYPVLLARPVLRRWFAEYGEHELPSSPVVLLSMLNIVAAICFPNGPCLIGSYVFMAGIVAVAAVARLLFRERKQHAEVVSTPSSSCAAETVPPHADFNAEDARTVTTTGSESLGSLDATCRDSDDLVSETEDGTDDPSAFLNLHGHATIHGFRLDPSPLVAEGGQGRVFKAECVEEGRLGLRKGTVVALKFVEETDQSPSFDDFERAVAYLREIKSPHVPRYYGCFRVERWINGTLKRFRMTVMEYLDGADLGYRVKVRSPNFYADEIMYVLDQLLKGLCDLAESGVIHRDIKPSNVFICRDGTVKLIDFDTALIRGIDLCPKNRKIVGTPEFAAPDYLSERFRGDEISDVFSVGMTLYYMVHGVSPHRAIGTLAGRMDEQCYSSFWRTRKPDCRSKTWWIKERESYCRGSVPLLGLPQVFHMALALDRDLRFTSFEDFRRSLQMVEFVRARHGKKGYVRVISCWECISGAGVGYSCVYGRSERGELHNWGIEGLRLVQPEQMEEKERSALLKIFHGWCNCSEPSFWFGGVHEGCVDIRDLFSSCSRTPLVMTEKFAAENVKVVQTSFDKIKSIEERRKEVEEHERAMDLS